VQRTKVIFFQKMSFYNDPSEFVAYLLFTRFHKNCTDQSLEAASFGKTPTTRVRLLISWLRRSNKLAVLIHTHDARGNNLNIIDIISGTTETLIYTYDSLNRLTSAEATGFPEIGFDESYSYDSQGRLTGLPDLGTYGYNDATHIHAVTHISGTQKYWYDPNGNMTTRIPTEITGSLTTTDTFYFDYDEENRLVTASTVPLNGSEDLTDWDLQKPITITYSGSTLTDYDILIELDTASLVTAGKLQSDCDDLRVVDSDGETKLDYWVEAGCNTSTTQLWAQVPSIPDGGKTVYVLYGNNSADNDEESWTGNFIMLASASCPAGWTRLTDMYDRFPRGSSSYGGTGGSSSHSHAQVSCTIPPKAAGPSADAATGSEDTRIGTGVTLIDTSHTHTDARVDVDTNSSVWPGYRDMVYCYNPDLEIDSGLIALFDDTPPSGWTNFSGLDRRFPRGASTCGGQNNANTHTHTTGGYDTSSVSDTTRKSGATSSAGEHYHIKCTQI
jgi:hypothetical protein